MDAYEDMDPRAWAREAEVGDYLAEYDDHPGPDDGARCGYDDPTLDDVSRILADRGMRLEADDVGLVAVADE